MGNSPKDDSEMPSMRWPKSRALLSWAANLGNLLIWVIITAVAAEQSITPFEAHGTSQSRVNPVRNFSALDS